MNKIIMIIEFIKFLFHYEHVVVVGYTMNDYENSSRYTTNVHRNDTVEVTEVLEQVIDRMNDSIERDESLERQEEGELVLNEIMEKWNKEKFKTE